eukprot:14885619-Alexandrium_andersonii.AAC.1
MERMSKMRKWRRKMLRSLSVQLPRPIMTVVMAASSRHPAHDWATSHWNAWGWAGIALAR